MKVAVIINTRNRPKEYGKVMNELLLHSTQLMQEHDFKLFVVDDASKTPYCDVDYRFEKQVGIPRAKNKGLRLAYDWGAEHLFLFDDDVYPISNDWWKPYINSGMNLLSYTFNPHFEETCGWKDGYIDKRLNIVVNRLACGCMMYLTRKVLDTVGGFDVQFIGGKYCDTEYQRRIHNAGLTPHAFMDVIGSDKLFHSMDEHKEVERSFSKKERDAQTKRNASYFVKTQNSKQFKSYE